MSPTIVAMARAMFPDAFNSALPTNRDAALMAGRQERALARAERGFMALPVFIRMAIEATEQPRSTAA